MSLSLSWLYKFGSPECYYQFAQSVSRWSGGFGVLLTTGALYFGIFVVPADYQQKDAFRMIYVHVPCAWLSMSLYLTMAIAESIYLIWRIKVSHMLALAIAPVGMLFTALALITGMIWGKPMWGVWWVWGDARLLTELLLLFIYILYFSVASSVASSRSNWTIASVLCIIGIINLPLIRYSVDWWTSLHQPSSITVAGKVTISSSMIYPLLVASVGFMLIAFSLIHIKIRSILISFDGATDWKRRFV